MLSPKQTIRRYVTICCSAAMSGDNALETPKKTYTSSVIGNQSCCRLCGLLKDVSHCKNLFKKANEQLLATAEAEFGGTLQRKELRPYLVCRPCERRMNNFRAFKAMSQRPLQRSERQERVKRCIEVSPLAPRTLMSAKDGATRRGLNFAVGAENQDLILSSTKQEVRKRKT